MNQTVLTNLQIFTNFSIRILGFTWEDKLGPVSYPVYAMTDEDGKWKFVENKISLDV